ncbi:MAG: hypothetical protein QM648_09105 [Solirubrobacterales bacterium]
MKNPAPTNRFSARRITLLAGAIATSLLALPQTAGAAPLWPDTPVSPVAKIVFDLFILVFALGVIALIGYSLALLGAGRAESDQDAPAATESSARGAIIGGVVAFLIFAIIGGFAFTKTSSAEKSTISQGGTFFKAVTYSSPGLKVAHVVKAPVGPAYTIRVNAQQFLWRYQYSDFKNAKWNTYSYNNLVLPAGVTVLLDFTSSDVEAAWWVPQLGGSITAVPGYNNKFWVRADKELAFDGAGTVVNGTNYANQITHVTVVQPALFARWVLGKQIEIDKAMTALGLERVSGEEEQLITGQKGAPAATAASEAEQTDEAAEEGK